MRNSNLYYIYTDHLNTPRAITDTANNMQWVWENKEAFGNNTPTEIISGFKFNLRFPGQYFDNETNLNYNIHRDYNPVWGRYTTSDPLGLAAGINTYGYVSGNSLGLSDKLGLRTDIIFVRQIWKPWDHAALRIDGIVFGIYPTYDPMGGAYSKAEISMDSLNSFKNKYSKPSKFFFTITLNLNVKQENMLKNYFYTLFKQNANKDNHFYYSLVGNQCATTINDALNTIGLKNEIFDNQLFKTPNQLFESLKTKGIQNGPYFPEDYQ